MGSTPSQPSHWDAWDGVRPILICYGNTLPLSSNMKHPSQSTQKLPLLVGYTTPAIASIHGTRTTPMNSFMSGVRSAGNTTSTAGTGANRKELSNAGRLIVSAARSTTASISSSANRNGANETACERELRNS